MLRFYTEVMYSNTIIGPAPWPQDNRWECPIDDSTESLIWANAERRVDVRKAPILVTISVHMHDEATSPELTVYLVDKMNEECGLNLTRPKFVNSSTLPTQKGLFD